jgi:hypothetical protein
MLAPHHGKNTKFGEVRLTPEDFLDPLEFFGRKTVLFDPVWCNSWIGVRCFARHLRPMLQNSRRPLKSLKSQIVPNRRGYEAGEKINAEGASARALSHELWT